MKIFVLILIVQVTQNKNKEKSLYYPNLMNFNLQYIEC